MNADREDVAVAQHLIAVLQQENDGGEPRFSDAEVLSALPFLVLAASQHLQPDALPPFALRVLAELSAAAGIEAGTSASEARRLMVAHARAHPIRPLLRQALEGALREELAMGRFPAWGLLGAKFETRRFEPRTAAAPKGTVRGGPLARFCLDEKGRLS